MKRIIKSLLVVTFLAAFALIASAIYYKNKFKAPPSQLSFAGQHHIRFNWSTDSLNGQPSAMLVPVKLPGCDHTFSMQFDLGATYSILYKNKIWTKNKDFFPIKHDESGQESISNITLDIGGIPVHYSCVRISNQGGSSIDCNPIFASRTIGTLGSEFIDNKVLIIDYPRQAMFIGDAIPDSIKNKVVLFDFHWTERRILLPGIIDKETFKFSFDTGCSAYSFLTSKSTVKNFASNGNVTIDSANSWGNTILTYTFPTNKVLHMGGATLPLKDVTYVDGASLMQHLMMYFANVGGVIGNSIFLEKTLVIDVQNQKYGIL